MVESRRYDLDLIFQALGDPTRRAILRSLKQHERAVTEVAKPFRMSLAAVSKHVKVLERARLVRRRREGSFSYLSLNPEAMLSADQWLTHYRSLWNDRLDALERLFDKEK